MSEAPTKIAVLGLTSALLLAGCGGDPPLPALAQAEAETSVVPTHGQVGNVDGVPVVVLGTSIEQTLYTPASGGVVPALASAGYSVISVDLPCHGADATDPTEDPLTCWAQRLHDGDDALFTTFCAKLSNLLDALGIRDAGLVGVSRGGYVAITCASYEPRFVAIALEAPVTDLNYLSEFKPLPVNEALFGTEQYVPYMKARAVLVRIGAHDTRVGTDLAEGFAKQVDAQVQVLGCAGHCAPEDGTTIDFFNNSFF